MDKKLKITVPLEITLEKVSNLLCSGMEGGINYWAVIGDYVAPEKVWHGKGDDDTFPHIDYPLSEGGSITVWEHGEELDPDFEESEDGDETDNMPQHRLDLAAIERGLAVMARVNPYQFGLFMNESGDAITGDVFVQCCLFGEEKYG
jgi:hypothetical protein